MPFDAETSAATADRTEPDPRPVALWLLGVAAMVWIMVALGGATRLTGSGLSIMEWAPLSGALPPLSEAEWQRLYDLYRTIPQYALVHAGFGLEGFKEIFWLEWTHRLWGRLIGLAYALPLAWFWLRGRIPAGYRGRLLLLLLLGGLQGAVGWFMVASGFEADRTAVSPYRLVLHLGLALGLFAALLWTGLSLLRAPAAPQPATGSVRRQIKAAAWLVVATMLAGGFVAGIKAGFDYNTFPLMDGQLVPEGYGRLSPWWQNLTANIPAVQFNHRLLATLTALAALGAATGGWRRLAPGAARHACLLLGGAVCLQYALGVATLVHVVPVWLGTLHQACAVLVLAAALLALHGLREPRRPA
ncbi:COX15/CtaA family protein [Paracraurococcus lichenis]|uniref:Heme A synthase n=1 Tax=Paracraurococcus lichenis TaxID=3064888 RepID=A0ABT9E337_9PROT|nr:COX15/CtaA family protein [Paracraurococcus sp. LOR1-02]MDO9710517.1 COX15/CtaA family protein [Paracraurococcus sp. LOR1-02]